jgi:GH15 family glucan-1,4-alpha-glucosidase
MLRIEDYALIGDCETAALVGHNGAIDWLCFPRFDSPACFSALLEEPENGRWLLAPVGDVSQVRRCYHQDTLILETEFTTPNGVASVIDFMPVRSGRPDLARVVVGRRGRVQLGLDLVIRFDYGCIVPWVRRTSNGIVAVGGPDSLTLRADVPVHGEDLHTVADSVVSEGQRRKFDLTCFSSHMAGEALDVERALKATEAWWSEWSQRRAFTGPWREAVVRSLITLKALKLENPVTMAVRSA